MYYVQCTYKKTHTKHVDIQIQIYAQIHIVQTYTHTANTHTHTKYYIFYSLQKVFKIDTPLSIL